MRTGWIATAVGLALLLAAAACAEDCAACTAKKICPAHEGADAAAVKAAEPLLRDKDMFKRREGIDALVEAGLKHANARSQKITLLLVKMLADPEGTVKSYAAEKLGEVGEEGASVPALSKEVTAIEKATPVDKPKKEEDQKKWEEQMRQVGSFYTGLGKFTTSPAAAAAFDRGIRSTSPWVCKAAAENCKGFRKNKVVIKALVDMLAKYFSNVVTEGNSAAWLAISMALPEATQCNDIPNQKDGTDAARWNSDWQKWWRANEKTLK
jgi:hypothetical protein